MYKNIYEGLRKDELISILNELEERRKIIQDRYFYLTGKYFGYPECCINHFIYYVNGVHKNEVSASPANEKGIPIRLCPECNLMSSDEILLGISSRRMCKTPFPDEGLSTDDGFNELSNFTYEDKQIVSEFLEIIKKRGCVSGLLRRMDLLE